jgi:putative membrane protein
VKRDKVIATAQFSSKLKLYMYLEGYMVLLVTVVGIPFMIVWFFIGVEWARRRFNALSCVLTEKSLEVKKGVMFRQQKTIPLEKITDVALLEGPILRWLGLCRLKVETAGSSAQGTANADLTGIIDADQFRDVVLAQRDHVADAKTAPVAVTPSSVEGPSGETLLTEIRDSLKRIEELLAR